MSIQGAGDFDWKAAEADVEDFGGNIDELNRHNERERDSYLRELDLNPNDYKRSSGSSSSSSSGSGSGSGGCYVATAVYGSYNCTQVWTLRRFRDNTLAVTWYGRAFIRVYYAVSPVLVKWFGKKDWFQALWKPMLDGMVNKLNEQGVADTPYKD